MLVAAVSLSYTVLHGMEVDKEESSQVIEINETLLTELNVDGATDEDYKQKLMAFLVAAGGKIKEYRDPIVATTIGSAAVGLNQISPTSALFAYMAWGASCKALMLKWPYMAKVAAVGGSLIIGAGLDLYVIPTYWHISRFGLLPLGIAACNVLVKKTIKTPAKEEWRQQRKAEKHKQKDAKKDSKDESESPV